MNRFTHLILFTIACVLAVGCASRPRAGEPLKRTGDEIVVCGQLFHTGGARVVLWTDPNGYDAYRTQQRFTPGATTRQSFEPRDASDPQPGLAAVQNRIDQFVLHYDACGASSECFRVLHDQRGLSVHFMLDTDGTIYQTLDLKERAWHATTSNSRSIGVEIANLGASAQPDEKLGQDLVQGEVQGQMLYQPRFTPQQYESLIKLTATVCKVFPKIRCDYPRDERGQLLTRKLPDEMLASYQGVLGHFHVQTNKTDPGPAFE